MCTRRASLAASLALSALGTAVSAQVPPAFAPDQSPLRLDEVGLYGVGLRRPGGEDEPMPLGWGGPFDERTGLACQPSGQQNGRHAFLLHCPWRGGTGTAYQEFRIRLPRATRIVLRGATAMRADSVGRSDGAVFRVRVNGRTQMEALRADAAWQPFALDLTPLAGQTASIRFETDPGPRGDPSFDFSLWGDRALEFRGWRPPGRVRPNPPPLSLKPLAGPQNDVAPRSGFPGRTSVLKRGGMVVFRHEAADGTMEYRWTLPAGPLDPPFGRIALRARMAGDSPAEVPLATGARLEWTGEARPVDSHWTRVSGGWICVRTFAVDGVTAKLQASGRMVGRSLNLFVSCDRPVLRSVDFGGWGPVVRRREIPVPYYSGRIHYLPAQNLFTGALLDWTVSDASSHESARALYEPLTDGSRSRVRERAVFTAAWHLPEVLPGIPNPPSPWRSEVGRRIVLDIWGGRFEEIARGFQRLADYGIRDCVALVHNWQRSGYDNALPAHVPANPELGGDPAMRALVAAGRRVGFLVALHENYVDYYPNYEGFDEQHVALDPAGRRVPAWYNPGTRIQSFAVKPNAILPLARTQSPEIHRRYGTSACYLDVHSAVPPWFHVDFRAGEDGAGTFRRVWEAHRELWRWERSVHGGPVFGEGNSHWYWSGCLDGVEAQFGAGWPANQGRSAPLMVDFDLLRIHPLQVNHGMGYYERWWDQGSSLTPPLRVLDQYRMQEAAFGHAGFLGGSAWNVVPLAWLEHHLLTPVAARHAAARPAEIAFHVSGRWVDSSAAARAGRWERVRVRWDNGLVVTANSAAAPLRADGLLLPQFGWSARGAGVRAWTATVGGVLADYAETRDSLFCSARNAAHWNLSPVRRIRPSVSDFRQTGPREFSVRYRWRAGQRLDRDWLCFVHFTAPDAAGEGIRFQQDHPLATPTSRWRTGMQVEDGPHSVRLPADLPDGDYGWSIGLFTPEAGRLPLEGPRDAQGRAILGVLRVRRNGGEIAFEPARSGADDTDRLHLEGLNAGGRVVDFGSVRTNGSARIVRQGSEWVLQTYPREASFTLELSAARFGRPVLVRSPGGSAPSVRPAVVGRRWRLLLNGAREYRWAASAATRR